jgi:class 3 adenylate cyclase
MDDDYGGVAVPIGARVAALVGAGEVLVSSTAKDLVAGSGLRFIDLARALKGVQGEWRIFAVEQWLRAETRRPEARFSGAYVACDR